MNLNMSRALTYLLAALLGILPGFFLVFNTVFSDVFELGELVVAFILVLIAYAFLGAIFGYLSSAPAWQLGAWLGLAAVLIVLWYTSNEPGGWTLHLAILIIAVGSAILGALIGRRLNKGIQRPAR